MRIPVNPQSYTISKDNNNTDYDVMGIGEIMIPRIPKLRTISWESYFPGDEDDPLAVNTGDFWAPKKYIDMFKSIMNNGEIIRFVSNRYTERGRPIFDDNIQALVTQFEVEEKGGTTGDFWYSVELTEYRDYTPLKVIITQPTTSTQNTSTEQSASTATTQTQRETPTSEIVVGSTVLCNGAYYASSYQDEPHGNFSGFRGKVSRIITNDPKRACPYHITTESGGARGWVKKDQIQVVT